MGFEVLSVFRGWWSSRRRERERERERERGEEEMRGCSGIIGCYLRVRLKLSWWMDAEDNGILGMLVVIAKEKKE